MQSMVNSPQVSKSMLCVLNFGVVEIPYKWLLFLFFGNTLWMKSFIYHDCIVARLLLVTYTCTAFYSVCDNSVWWNWKKVMNGCPTCNKLWSKFWGHGLHAHKRERERDDFSCQSYVSHLLFFFHNVHV